MSVRVRSSERPAVASPIQSYLEILHRRHATASDGTVATYIPELAKADPDWFSIALATTDGKLYAVGDTSQTFTTSDKIFVVVEYVVNTGSTTDDVVNMWINPSYTMFGNNANKPAAINICAFPRRRMTMAAKTTEPVPKIREGTR